MRIIGNIDHPVLKITVFKMGNKISIKFESGMLEQTYKFRRREGLENFAEVQRFVSQEFTKNVLKEFERMHQIEVKTLDRLSQEKEPEEFDEIV